MEEHELCHRDVLIGHDALLHVAEERVAHKRHKHASGSEQTLMGAILGRLVAPVEKDDAADEHRCCDPLVRRESSAENNDGSSHHRQ